MSKHIDKTHTHNNNNTSHTLDHNPLKPNWMNNEQTKKPHNNKQANKQQTNTDKKQQQGKHQTNTL